MREQHERRIEEVMLELSHRSKNLLTVVQSIACQVARRTTNFEDFDNAFSDRIHALANMHDLLVERNWMGADIREVIRSQLLPFGEDQFHTEGAALILKPKAVENIGLVFHELATNATKYGALSEHTGLISIRWKFVTDSSEARQIEIVWQESGGPVVTTPDHKGFGHMVITHLAPKALEGSASIDFAKDGFRWTLVAPVVNVTTDPSAQQVS